MPPGSRALALVLILIATAAVLLLASGGSEAADIEHMDDWVISSGTVLVSDKTIDVHGNVTVQGGAVLKLYNCTLDILCVVNGQYSMEVQADGRLEAYGSTITGSDGYVDFWFRDDVVLEGCQLSRANGVQSGGSIRGIMVVGGPVTMTDTVISDCRYQGIYAQADLNLDNVTVQDVDQSNVYMTNWGASAGDIAISIRDCTFHGSSAGGWWGAGVYFGRWGGDPDLDLTLLSTTFLGGARGVYISGGSNSDVVVDDCEFHECEVGVAFSTQTTSGDYSISNNIVDGNDLADSVGFSLTIADGFVPTLVNNVVQRVTTAYSITGPWTGSATESLGNLTVSNCSRGVVTDRSVSLTVHNSSFAQMTSGLECFVADGGSTITIRDTVHPWGSGTVLNSNSWIRAHIDIGIRGARWKDGDAIAEGELVLENITQYEVARFNLSAVRSQDMIGWEVTNTDRRTSIYLYPAMYIEGHGFRGDRIDLRTYTPSIVEIVDDYVPSLDISSPPDGRGFNVTTVLCDGPFDE
nr:right-handed parallel beta-helix repeat-containing protein [Thermoplasmata archaeon]NIS12891.1 right-handed parallel beta-helix repeat-containing protein [Thermoplasmata archaeon]NIS19403.1 right-handed parallel beta-helix repeat-containing protein [Thermoplasmata archaeon]NIT78216.1 right-handed parallel beta-helix repeat-containing protein [Thermoplasmata archaeon]NIU48523.1 right-handed parallel beta-helix repeat-containing protein [Thermoplasmata archaeon]